MLIPDVVNALAGWLTARYGDAVLAGAAHNVLGDAQQRAFREAVSGAIVRVTESVPREQAADRRAFLAAVLIEHRERLEELRNLPDLATAVHALIDSLDDPSDPHLVAPPGLAEALIAEINLGVLDNARAGGPLAPLAAEANFAELFALGEQMRAALETILARLNVIEHELRDRGAPVTINNFTGGWRPLRTAYLDPADARTAILQKPFTGRTWLKREIDAFIGNRDRGYFIVQADAGTGKTAFALWYSGLDQYPIHFTEYSRDARTTASAVRNLAAQLIMLWGLDELAPDGHLPADADWSSWLRQVLTAAAEKRDADDPGRRRPIVLVVDGLDEADERSVDHLPFGLPDDLPTRVYVVATVRTGGLPHQPKLPKVVCDWNKRKAEQQEDLRAFITESVQLRLVSALPGDGLTPAAFVTALLDRCGDVWLYLHYVLEEIASGYRRPRDVPLLPAGLEDYYHNTIVRFCEQDADETWRVPLLATLAIAVEPLNVETLVNLAGLDDHPQVWRFLVGPLLPFLSREEVAGQPDRFRLKHPSFAEFLARGPGPDIGDSPEHRSEDEHNWRTRLAAECRRAGQRVCDRYLTAWGGLEAGLPDLAADPSLAQCDGGYPLRALATHLLAAALIPRLPDDLLDGAVQAVADRAQEFDVLVAAAALVDRLPEGRLNNFPWSAMPDMHYERKVVVSSMVGLKCGYPGAADRALEHLVDEVDNKFIRCQYLARLIPRLPATAFDATMAVLEDCPARYRSDALLALARHAPVDKLTDVLELASAVHWEITPPEAEQHPWLRLMQEVGPRLTEPDQKASALAVAFALQVTRRAEAIEVLAPRLTTELARQALQDIEADLPWWVYTDDAKSLMIAVGALAKRLPPAEAHAVVKRYVTQYCHVDENLCVVLQPRDDDEPAVHEAELLAPVAAHLPHDTVRLTVRSICRGISWTAGLATELTPALSRLAPAIADDPTLIQEAVDMVLKVSAGWWPASRLTVLSVLAPHLTDDSLDKAIKLVMPGPIEAECFAAVAALGRELAEDQRTKVARRALDAALEIASDTQRTCAIAGLAPALRDDLAEEALEFVESVTHSVLFPSVLNALDSLAPQLPATALPCALEIFIDTPACKIHKVTRLFERLGRDDRTGAIRNLLQSWPQEDAWPKDSWLWALAPFLTESLAEEALAIARTLPVDYARRLSMAALAPRLPDGLRAAVAHEVLELLDVPPDDVGIRIAVLARLAAATMTDEVTAAYQRLLSGLQPRDLYRTNNAWDALDELVTHLPTDLIEIVLGFSTLLFPDERFLVIRTIAPRLPERLLLDLVEALESVTAETDNELRERARALIALATRVPDEDERHRILAAVLNQMIQSRWWNLCESAFVELIPLLPPPSRSQAVSAAVRQCFNQYRLGDLGPLLSVLEGPELDLVFAEVDRVRDPHERATATAAVLRRAGALADRSMVFRDLDVFGGLPPACTRAEMFAIVGASAWWIRQQGGNRAVAATIDAMFDVSRWWR